MWTNGRCSNYCPTGRAFAGPLLHLHMVGELMDVARICTSHGWHSVSYDGPRASACHHPSTNCEDIRELSSHYTRFSASTYSATRPRLWRLRPLTDLRCPCSPRLGRDLFAEAKWPIIMGLQPPRFSVLWRSELNRLWDRQPHLHQGVSTWLSSSCFACHATPLHRICHTPPSSR